MAKLGSSSRPLEQGMMLLALLLLLLLASIQAGPVMAQEQGLRGAVEWLRGTGEQVFHGAEEVGDRAVKKLPDKAANKLAKELCKKRPDLKGFCDGARWGIKVHTYLCKAQGWMDKQQNRNPGGAAILAADVSKIFPAFSYFVRSQGGVNSVVTCSSVSVQPQVPAPLLPPNGVWITGILVGQDKLAVQMQTPAPPASYTYLESILYDPLREVVARQIRALNPPAAVPTADSDKLCYATVTPLSLPPIAILLASDNNVVQPMMMELGVPTAVWYPDSAVFCLGIRRIMDRLIRGTP